MQSLEELKTKVLSSRTLYISHMEAVQNIVRLHKSSMNGSLEEMSSLASTNYGSLEEVSARLVFLAFNHSFFDMHFSVNYVNSSQGWGHGIRHGGIKLNVQTSDYFVFCCSNMAVDCISGLSDRRIVRTRVGEDMGMEDNCSGLAVDSGNVS